MDREVPGAIPLLRDLISMEGHGDHEVEAVKERHDFRLHALVYLSLQTTSTHPLSFASHMVL